MKNGLHLLILLDQMYLTVESYLDKPDFVNHITVIGTLIVNGFGLIREIKKTLEHSPRLKEMYDKFIQLQLKYLQKCHLENLTIRFHKIGLNDTDSFSLQKANEPKPYSYYLIRIVWNLDPDRLRILFSELIKGNYIDCTFEEFEQCFFDTGHIHKRIRWLKKIKQLARLFYILREEEKIISEDSTPKIIEQHFLDKHGRPLKNTTLRANPKLPLSFEFEEKIKRIVWLLKKS